MPKHLRLLSWLASGTASLALLTLPVSNQAQLALSLAVIAAMVAIWSVGRGRYARWAFLTLGTAVVCRYIFWRATSTLPPVTQPINFALGVTLLAAELYCVFILVVSLIINADPLERPDLPRDPDKALPTVDVFIPTYNESESILAVTISAAKLLDYPADKLTVWLLDDGGSDQKCGDGDAEKAAAAKARRATLQALCANLGARYLTRAKNEHAKAGNLNNGLKHARGAIVVVFDADHAPFRNFLRETVGHFARDPKLFLVQTPHVFLNPDPIERNLRTFQRMPSENEMFYSITQRGLDKWNGSFFCGSAALLRREALDVVGGFSGITITEDCETAFELHSKGWTSVFVDKPMIAGLQPETLESFIGQRSRWCQGMFQLLVLKNPIVAKGLHPIQRVAYLSSMVFWLFPVPRLVFTVAPLLHIFFNVKIFVSSMDEAVAYTATYMIVNLMLQNYLYGRVRWPFMSELYEYVQGVYLFKAIVAVMLKPRSPTFNVTAKGISLDQDHLSSLAWPFFAIFGVLALGTGTAFYRYVFEPGADLMLIVGLWTAFNLIIAGVALGVAAERREPDRHPRLGIERSGTLTIDGETVAVAIRSVSAGGCSIEAGEGGHALGLAEVGARCSLSVAPIASAPPQGPLTLDLIHRVTASGITTVGFAFAEMAPASYIALADLMYGDAEAMPRFLGRRRVHMNLLRGTAQFVLWGLTEPVRAFSYIGRRTTNAAAQAIPQPLALPAAASEAVASPMPILQAEPAAPLALVVQAEPATPASQPAPVSWVAPVEAAPVAPVVAPVMEPVHSEIAAFLALVPRAVPVPTPAPVFAEELDFDALSALVAGAVAVEPAAIAAASSPDAPARDAVVPTDWLKALLALADREAAPDAVAEPASSSAVAA